MMLSKERVKGIVQTNVNNLNKYYDNPLMSIEPSHEIKKRSSKKEYIRMYSELAVSNGFKISHSEIIILSEEQSLYLVHYHLKSGWVSKKSQTLSVVQRTPDLISEKEILELTRKQEDNFNLTLSYARWIDEETLEIFSFSRETRIVLYKEVYTLFVCQKCNAHKTRFKYNSDDKSYSWDRPKCICK